jgi:hypothetical protein
MIKLLIVQFSPVSSHLLHLRPKYLPHHSIPKHPVLDTTDQVSHLYKMQRKYVFYIRIRHSAHCAMHVICLLHRQHTFVFPLYLLCLRKFIALRHFTVFSSCLFVFPKCFAHDRTYSESSLDVVRLQVCVNVNTQF